MPGSSRCWSCRPSITAISSTASDSGASAALIAPAACSSAIRSAMREPHVAVAVDEAVVTWMVDVDALGGQHGEQADQLGPSWLLPTIANQRVREPGALEHPLDALQVLLLVAGRAPRAAAGPWMGSNGADPGGSSPRRRRPRPATFRGIPGSRRFPSRPAGCARAASGRARSPWSEPESPPKRVTRSRQPTYR